MSLWSYDPFAIPACRTCRKPIDCFADFGEGACECTEPAYPPPPLPERLRRWFRKTWLWRRIAQWFEGPPCPMCGYPMAKGTTDVPNEDGLVNICQGCYQEEKFGYLRYEECP